MVVFRVVVLVGGGREREIGKGKKGEMIFKEKNKNIRVFYLVQVMFVL